MHILIVPSWYPTKENNLGGIFVKEQAVALNKFGCCKVTVAFPDLLSLKAFHKQHNGRGSSFAIEDGVNTYRYREFNYFGRVPYGAGISFYKCLKNIYRTVVEQQGKPDIIHAHTCLWGGYAAARLSESEKTPFVLTEHASAFLRGHIKPYQKSIIRDILNTANAIIAVGPTLRKAMEQYSPRVPITVLPNLVNLDYFGTLKVEKHDKHGFCFFTLATLNANKGMDILLKAFAAAFKNTDAEIVVGGDGEERVGLESLAKKLGIGQQIVFVGQLSREEVRRQMSRCDAFVLASRVETFGVVFIEALASGKPIIATKCGGPEMIINDFNGLLVPVDDIDALADAMINMKNNYETYNSEDIRRDCEERFGEKAVLKKIESIYTEICKL